MRYNSLWDLRATYDDHLSLIRKRVVDFLFWLGVTAEALRGDYQLKIGEFAPTGAG